MVARFLHPWRGTAIRHIPAGSPYDVLDTRFAGLISLAYGMFSGLFLARGWSLRHLAKRPAGLLAA